MTDNMTDNVIDNVTDNVIDKKKNNLRDKTQSHAIYNMKKRRQFPRQLVAWVLAFCLFFGSAAPAFARETDYFPPLREGLSRAELPLLEADLADFYELEARVMTMSQLENENELLKAVMEYTQEYRWIAAEVSLANFAYYCDPKANEALYLAWEEKQAEAFQAYNETWRRLLQSDNRSMFEKLMSQAQIEAILSDDRAPAGTAELAAKIRNMANSYWQAMGADYSADWQGKSYNFDNVQELAGEAYNSVYLELCKQRNQAAGQILAEGIPACNAYARALGYQDFAAYRYASYGRDYTPQEAARLHQVVKERILPLYKQVGVFASFNRRFDQQALNQHYNFRKQQVVLDTAAAYMPMISDEYAETLAYLREKDLLDIEYDADKLGVAFTTYIPFYRLALIFNGSQMGTPRDFSSFIHEFGHFACFMYGQDNAQHDVNEFYAQGLELLFLHFADDIFGEDGDTYRLNAVEELLGGIVTGCLYDEFQQKVYQLEQPTVQQINEIFHELSLEYGYVYGHEENQAYNWVETAHTFIEPFYYISYATSSLEAAELLVRSYEDFEAAADDYLGMVGTLRQQSFKAFFADAGYGDVFAPQELERLADRLEDYIYEEICEIANVESIKKHWAGASLLAAAGRGVLLGDEQGSLRPDSTVNRAEAYTMLWRWCGAPQAEVGRIGAPAGSWYEQPANWAAANGLLWDDKSESFGAEEPMTREQIVWVLWRLAEGEYEELPDKLSGFADEQQIADWARDAMNWGVNQGLVNGNDLKQLEPKRTASRAELVSLVNSYLNS